MKLSACYIVRDEAENLAHSLASVQPLVDEVIVVDTGSTDDTVEIARQFGAEISSFRWIDDFAAARNTALSHVTGDYAFILDADEALSEGFTGKAGARQEIESFLQQHGFPDGVMLRRYNVESWQARKEADWDCCLRLLRITLDIRYVGRIHEQPERKAGSLSTAKAPDDWFLWHVGYAERIIRRKLERNLHLLQQEAEKGDPVRLYGYFADCYYGLGEYQKAADYARKAVDSDIVYKGGEIDALHMLTESRRKLGADDEELLALAREGERRYPHRPEFFGEAGMALSALGLYDEAEKALIASLERFEKLQVESDGTGGYFTHAVAAKIATRLAAVEEILGRKELAAEWKDLAARYSGKTEPDGQMDTVGGEQDITVCYIVKDEADDLAVSLASIRHLDARILVCMTREDHAVRQVVLDAGAELLTFVWQDDFSAARNYVLERVQSRWIVFLDADECFSEETRGHIRPLLAKEAADVLLVPWRNIEKATGEEIMTSYAPRIFRGDKGFRYRGAIHEQLADAVHGDRIENTRFLAADELLLIHTGYSEERQQEKARRNIALLQEKERKEGETPLTALYLAEAYDGVGDRAKAVEAAWRAVQGGRQAILYASRGYDVLLRNLIDAPAEERKKAAVMAVHDFPELPAYRAELANCLAAAGDLAGAIREMDAALAIRERDPLEPAVFDDRMRELAAGQLSGWKEEASKRTHREVTPSKGIAISACVIAKNEEKDIRNWLASTDFADERILIDTGCEDRTVEIAREAGIAIYLFPWTNDFAAARNEALRHVTGDWIVFLDADERFEHPEEVRPYLERFDWQAGAGGYTMISSWMKNIDEDDGNREMQRFQAIRIFRGGRGLRYEGKIHETLIGADGPAVFYEDKALMTVHAGYSSRRIVAKTERNLAMLLADIEANGESPKHYPYLAKCYQGLGDYREAELYALKAIDSPLSSVGSSSDMYRIAVAAMEENGDTAEAILSFLAAAESRFPELPDFYARRGILLADMGRDGEAAEALDRALQIAEKETGGEASDFASLRAETMGERARLYAAGGDWQSGERLLAMMGEDGSQEMRVLEAQWEICGKKLAERQAEEFSVEKQRKAFCRLFPDTREEMMFLARFFESQGHIHAYLAQAGAIRERWGANLPRVRLYHDGVGSEELVARMTADVEEIEKTVRVLQKEKGAAARQVERQIALLLPKD